MSGTTPTRSRAGAGPHPTPPARSPATGDAPRSLVEQLGDALRDERVACLQWKGNWKRNRWMSGEGDIDLLVDRPGEARFRSVLTTLGFRRADPPPQSAIAGIESYFGLDLVTGRLIHVHVHYRLVIGGIWRTVYRLPIETPLLASAVQGTVFRVPAGEFELITFAARMVQRYSAIDTLRRRQPAWLTGIQGELDALLAKTDRARLEQLLATHLPCLDVPFIDDTAALSILQLRAKARRMVQQYGVKLFVIDYLQLLHSTSRRAENRQQEIADISNGIKALAKELNVPVMVLSQLNRELEKDKNRKPRLSDLRESGAIEQDADLVALLYKPVNGEEEDGPAPEQEAAPVNLVIAKQRNGPTGDVSLTFLKAYTRFESAAKVSAEDVPIDS